MQLHEQNLHHQPANNDGAAAAALPPAGLNLEALRHEAAAFLAAGSAIINATLSGNSSAFLVGNRQNGGQ